MKARTPANLRARAEQVSTKRIPNYNLRSPKVQWAARVAVAMGLKINDHTRGRPGDGIHSKRSLHYSQNDRGGKIRAVDVGGSAKKMSAYWDMMRKIDPGSTALFYDPRGAIKNGRRLRRSIGGHRGHVHYGSR